ncbi:MAG TPA: NACHT domain-containing protein [Trichormus sp. M33_DOE_039]|nr:NACHT domain-containing protein [Trichormus sp. M33_DOE_039]
MLDWLAFWGATQAVGLIVKPILEDLVKEAGKDWAKDFLKGVPSKILNKLKKEDIEIAAAKALKEFLELMQQDLKDSGLTDDEIKSYKQPIKHYLKNQEVKQILGSAFKDEAQTVDINKLAELWDKVNPDHPLPDDFNWKRLGKKYIQKVKDIILEFPELREVIDSKNIEQIKEYTKERAGIIPEFDLQRYQEGIRERYGNLKLESLDTSGYAYNELKLWQMFIAQNVREVHQVLPQVHELPKEHLRRLRESDQLEAEIQAEELEQHKRVYPEQSIRLVLDVVNDRQNYKYIVILGNPGSGKSTLLQFLALNWATSPLDNAITQPIPLLIELSIYIRRRYNNECNNFIEFFHKCSGVITHLNQHQLHEQLKAGNAVVMFDGLDEIFELGQQHDVITDIHRFTNDYPDVRVIVTSRVIGYKPQRLRDAEFSHFMLQDLDSEQIQDFIRRWHELTFKDEADRVIKRERLQRAIETSKAIAELAGNPLLLTMMAILNRNQELPRDRPELYDQASRVLLHRWDVERALIEDQRLDPKTIDYKDKQAMLRQVAYFMQTSDKGLVGNVISAGDLKKIVTDYLKTIEVSPAREAAQVMINQLRTRNFILCSLGADYYAFVHRTFLEYFCAWEFVWQFEKERAVTIDVLKTEVFGKHWQDETWHEVLQLIAGMIEPKFTGEILEYLIKIADFIISEFGDEKEYINILFLASECLSNVRNRSVIASTDNKLHQHIKRLTEYEAPCNPADVAYTSEEYSNSIYEIRSKAFLLITTTWRNHIETLPWIKTIARSGFHGDDGYIQAKAVRELARAWKKDPETLPIIKSLTQTNANINSSAVYSAIEELAQGWKDDPATLPIIKYFARSSNDSFLQAKAVQQLARNWKYDPETLSILQSLVQFSKNGMLLSTVVKELAQGWKNDLNILSILKQSFQFDSFGYIRHEVMEELIQGWQLSPEIYDFLYECATDDTFNPIFLDFSSGKNTDVSYTPSRQIALEAIIKQFAQHPQTLPLLRDRAENDLDEKVREYAQKQLKRWEG